MARLFQSIRRVASFVRTLMKSSLFFAVLVHALGFPESRKARGSALKRTRAMHAFFECPVLVPVTREFESYALHHQYADENAALPRRKLFFRNVRPQEQNVIPLQHRSHKLRTLHRRKVGTMRYLRQSLAVLALAFSGASLAQAADAPMPAYDHIFLIILENHTTDEIIGDKTAAPVMTRLAKDYGLATNYYAIRHPSEPNYVAMVGGDTFGISDDDAFYCKAGSKEWGCSKKALAPGYADHTVDAPNLASQLDAKGISWKGYFEDIPEPGSLVYRWPSKQQPAPGKPDSLYAVKHNGFMTFKSVQDDPRRAEKIVGFDQLDRDLASGAMPRFAYIVPNQCNDMHGLGGHDVPEDCTGKESAGLIGRADRTVGKIVDGLMNSAAWKTSGNNAIVITFDENDDDTPSSHPLGCCGFGEPGSPGGGWIATVVITNHGQRHFEDPTPYNHYSLLRTIEAAFGIDQYLGHAADSGKGVVTMTPLFAPAK